MKVACDRSLVASHAPLGGEESRIPRSQLVAVQHTERWTRTGTPPAKDIPDAIASDCKNCELENSNHIINSILGQTVFLSGMSRFPVRQIGRCAQRAGH